MNIGPIDHNSVASYTEQKRSIARQQIKLKKNNKQQ